MNVVREIQKINKAELAKAGTGQGGSWHDQYKDSAYIFIGGLAPELTEGDVITIFSQFGEPVDINLPRDKQTGRTRGFGFLMYEDQKSTILAVDNLNGSKVLNRTLRVDHVSKYKQLEKDDESGKFREADSERMNARLELFMNDGKAGGSDSEASSADEGDLYEGIDPDDPMAAYLIAQRKEERAITGGGKKVSKSGKKESKAERRARREERRLRKLEKEERKRKSGSARERSPRERSEREHSSRARSYREDTPERNGLDRKRVRRDGSEERDNYRWSRRWDSEEGDVDRKSSRRRDDSRERSYERQRSYDRAGSYDRERSPGRDGPYDRDGRSSSRR